MIKAIGFGLLFFSRRRSHVENVYVDILQNGYFESFEEMFQLVNKQADDRLKAGPDSFLWLRTPLSQQPGKLEMMARFLKEAEDARRLG